MSQPSAAATRQVILGYKCVHEGCQKSFESRKGGTTFTGRQIVASIAEMSSSGAKSFRAARQLLSTQSFISSPLSTRHIKERIAECAKTRVANNWKTKERSNIIFEKYRAFRSKPSCWKYYKNHAKSITFCGFLTLFGLPVVEGNTEEFCEIFRKFKLLAIISQVLHWGSIATHIYFSSFSHVYSVFGADATELYHVLHACMTFGGAKLRFTLFTQQQICQKRKATGFCYG